MQLSTLTRSLPIQGSGDGRVSGIRIDTRKLQPGELFVALQGQRRDGHDYLSRAIEAGAGALLIEPRGRDRLPSSPDLPVLETDDPRQVLPSLLERFYGNPSDDLLLAGVTGTNGKTTTTHLLASVFEAAGESVGLIGTIAWRFKGEDVKGPSTTPSVVENFRRLTEWSREGATAVVMEVSSHGLDQGRVRGLQFDVGGFTNLSQDHLDYHRDMESYFETKVRLIDRSDRKVAYAEGEYGGRLARRGDVVSVDEQGDYRVEDPRVGIEGIRLTLHTPGGETMDLRSPLTGLFNYRNVALAAAMAHQVNVDTDAIVRGIRQCTGVPGRCERLEGPPTVVVDYAHTPDAMDNVIDSLKPLVDGRLICVFGAGGDRDRGKRPRMGSIAARGADYAVVTSDNPRSEPPESIIDDILAGMQGTENYHVQVDRGQAIREAIQRAEEDDLVLIVGKGHETEQVIGDRVIPFEDRAVAREVLETLD